MLARPKSPAWLAAGAIALVPFAIGGCGGGSDDNDSSTAASDQSETNPSAPVSGPGGKIDVSETEYKLNPADPTVKPGKVTINVSNDGKVLHALEVEGPNGESKSGDIQPGAKTTLTADLPPGTYEWYCPIDGHKDLGMKGEITVK